MQRRTSLSCGRPLDRARAALEASIAGVTRQQATLELARTNRQRFEELFKNKLSPPASATRP